ncbi:hypothetical protein LY28_02120 [Ruminiclostridium sufflavum DSM 19573]|uniref:Uncharacterized protein n=1 Tax=Ruminiclostridium sufflavum DSM 19573 TaxID=1121337 RepID=A0A318Y635_9FIRM|nr:hypothetical protein [Ruminiclostridium sufflavum]PYG87450.1 hypothetical protein LY28_02120 [Ruminiclostridium sufflavum DSM 19573]
MAKRVFAWILLVGFLLLIVNIMTVQYLLGPSVMVYIAVVVLFVFKNKPLPGRNKESEKAGQSDRENT